MELRQAASLAHFADHYVQALKAHPAVVAAKATMESVAPLPSLPPANAPSMARGVLHVCVGALRLNDHSPDHPLVPSCSFSSVIHALCIELGVPHKTHLIDLHNKPEWFTRVWSNGRLFGTDIGKPSTPAVFWLSDDACETDAYAHGEVMADSHKIIESLGRWFPRVASTTGASALAAQPAGSPFAGRHRALNVIIKSWSAVLATAPITDEDEASAEHRAKREAAINALLAALAPVEATLATRAFLASETAPGLEDFRLAPFALSFDDLEARLAPEAQARRFAACPHIVSWCARMRACPAIARTLAQPAELATRASMVHMIDRYMPQLRAHVAYAAAQRIVAHLAPAPEASHDEDCDSESDDETTPGSPTPSHAQEGITSIEFCL